jgi:hypothetical protein
MTRIPGGLVLGLAGILLGAAAPQPPSLPETTPQYEQRDQPVTPEDLQILQRAGEILSDPSKWDRHDDRVCSPEDRTWSLYCALQKACIEVLGEYQHRRVALQEVRFAVEEATKDMELEHRLMDFNNLPSTRFEDVKKVLATASERVKARLAAEKAPGSVTGEPGSSA